MIEVSDELAAAIEAAERSPLVRLRVDWDGDGYATTAVDVHGVTVDIDDLSRHAGEVKIDRALTTDMPDAVRVASGYAAAQADVTLNRGDPLDESLHAALYFTRGSARSPLAEKERIRRPSTVDIGMATAAGPQYVRRLTGRTRRLTTRSSSRTASLEILDGREDLRDTVTLTAVDGVTRGAEGTYVVTQALAACGIGAGPLPRGQGSLWWVPMYGSIAPVTGDIEEDFGGRIATGDLFTNAAPSFSPGPFVLHLDGLVYTSDTDMTTLFAIHQLPDRDWDARRGRLEFWTDGTGVTTGPAGTRRVQFTALPVDVTASNFAGPIYLVDVGIDHDGTLYLRLYDSQLVLLHEVLSTLDIAVDGGFHFIGIGWDHTQQKVVFRVDDTEETVATSIDADDFNDDHTSVGLNAYSCKLSDVHLHDVALTEPWLNVDIPVTAVIDRSRLRMDAIADPAPKEVWALLAEMAAAEQAVSFFDEDGIYRYRTRARLTEAAGQTVQQAVSTVDAGLLDDSIDDGIDQVRNIVQVSYTPVAVTGPEQTVGELQLSPIVTLTPGAPNTFVIPFDRPAVQISTHNGWLTYSPAHDGEGSDSSVPWVVVTTNADGTDDGNLGSTVAFNQAWYSFDLVSATYAIVTITNRSTKTVYLSRIALQGTSVVSGAQTVVERRNTASVALYGPQPLQLSMPQWVQRRAVAGGLARSLLGELKDPHPTVTDLQVVGDPRRQLGDRVRIADPDGTALDGEYWLTAVTDDVSETGGYTQTIVARQATSVMRWGAGAWNTHTWG